MDEKAFDDRWKLMNLRLKTRSPKEIAEEVEGGYAVSWRKERGARFEEVKS